MMSFITNVFKVIRLIAQLAIRIIPFTLGWVVGCAIDAFIAGKDAGEEM